jgi:hypothetical protein
LLDIYEALGEEPVFAFNPNRPNSRCPVSRSMDKILEPVFETTQTMVKEGLAKLRVSDLVKNIR